jgi:hypothetical protein
MIPIGARAGTETSRMNTEHWWTGRITAVNTQDNTISGKHLQYTRTFRLGEKCPISAVDNHQATLGDLRPGEKVRISYRDVEGVLVANHITEQALSYHGTVQNVDPKTGTVQMEEARVERPFRAPKSFQIAGDCQVILWNGQEGNLADVHPGDRVSVVYELPNRQQVAYRIREQTASFEGVADTIDLPARTLKAKEGSQEVQFVLGNHCRFVQSDGKTGHLKDLQPGHDYRFTYEEVNGIDVLDRIAPAPPTNAAKTASVR